MAETIQVSYTLETDFGLSAPQDILTVELEEDEVFEFEPEFFPENVTAWYPEFISANPGGRFSMGKMMPGQMARISTGDPGRMPRGPGGGAFPSKPPTSRPREDPDVDEEDETGIDGPSSALGDIVPVGITLPPTGKYTYKMTKKTIDPDDGTEAESAPGPEAFINVTAGHFVRVRPPIDYRNWFSNPQLSRRVNDPNSFPDSWEFPAIPGVTFETTNPGVMDWTDISDGVDDVDLAISELFDVSSKPFLVIAAVVDVEDYVSGKSQYVLRQNLDGGGFLDTVIDNITGNGEHEIEATIGAAPGPGETAATISWHPDVLTCQFIIRHIGSSGDGPRNNRKKWRDFLIMPNHRRRGLKPKKRRRRAKQRFRRWRRRGRPGDPDEETQMPPIISPPTVPPQLPYPVFGYTVVVENPVDAQRPAWTGGPSSWLPGNFVEYYGPENTPVTSTYFMGGMKMPVKPGETRTISAHFFWAGVDSPGTPLRAVLKNSKGEVIEDLGTFEDMAGVTGESADEADADAHGWVRRWFTFTAPVLEDPGYIELVAGGVGDGLYRIMGLQNELGAVMTSWTADLAAQGFLISTFDLAIPGVPEDSKAFEEQSGVRKIVKFDAEVTHPEGGDTSHLVEARSKAHGQDDSQYTTWTTDPGDLPLHNKIIQVKTTLETTDLLITPELHSHYVDFIRDVSTFKGYGVLCRSDGTELDGGVVVFEFPPIQKQNPIVEETFADNTGGFGTMGQGRFWANGFGAECYLDSTAEELMALIGEEQENSLTGLADEDSSTVVVEYLGKRHVLRVLALQLVPVTRDAHVEVDGLEYDGKWLHRAEGIRGESLDEAEFR
jgi:hypothetical protein